MRSAGGDRSLRAFLNELPDDEETLRAKAMLMRHVEGFHAADVDRVGIRGLVAASDAADSIEGDTSFRIERGYHSLMAALESEARSYGTTFQLETIVREIGWSNRAVRVRCQPAGIHGSEAAIEFSARRAVITIPLQLLQTDPNDGGIRFVPDLPLAKQAAIKKLLMGNVLKINLCFRQRFWEEVVLWDERAERVSFHDAGFFHYPDAPIPTWWTQLPVRAPLLVGWAGGPRADHLRDAADSEQFLLAGELSLDGGVRSIRGVLSMAYAPEGAVYRILSSRSTTWRKPPSSRE